MREIPILFSTPMVQAILEGRKTMTRRIVKGLPNDQSGCDLGIIKTTDGKLTGYGFETIPYQPGDILWVRETWYYESHMHDLTAGEPDLSGGLYSHRFVYRASSPDYPINVGVGEHGWKPSIFMPKVAARIWLEVVSVRVERLQEITEEDAIKEGLTEYDYSHWPDEAKERVAGKRLWECAIKGRGRDGVWDSSVKAFIELWDSINQKRGYGWDASPWVWVVEFRRVER